MTDSDAGWLDWMDWASVAIQVGQTLMSRPAAVAVHGCRRLLSDTAGLLWCAGWAVALVA